MAVGLAPGADAPEAFTPLHTPSGSLQFMYIILSLRLT
jgi:hypothetical protein